MKHYRWQIFLGLSLIFLSVLLYCIHFFVFQDAHHIFIYMLGDIAFVPIEVLFVTLIIHQLLTMREKRSMLKKLNMVIGAFFSEVGTHLLKSLSEFDSNPEKIRNDLVMNNDWPKKRFLSIRKELKNYDCRIDCHKGTLGELQKLLVGKRSFLLTLLENANLLEHESFTDLLWAVFHLTEELAHRTDVMQLSDNDSIHIAGDIKRAYTALISEWLDYMKHLKDNYPYLFSLAMRTNPFDPDVSPEFS